MSRYRSDIYLIDELHFPPFDDCFQLNVSLRGVTDYGPTIILRREDGEDWTTVRVRVKQTTGDYGTYKARTPLKVVDALHRIERYLDGEPTVTALANSRSRALANIPLAIRALNPEYPFAREPEREYFCRRCAAQWDGPDGRNVGFCPVCAGDRVNHVDPSELETQAEGRGRDD